MLPLISVAHRQVTPDRTCNAHVHLPFRGNPTDTQQSGGGVSGECLMKRRLLKSISMTGDGGCERSGWVITGYTDLGAR